MTRTRRAPLLAVLALSVAALLVASLAVGGYDISLAGLVGDPAQREMLLISRVPRTLALVFAGVALALAGVIMQLITQNRFVEPSTAGSSQWAGLGILVTAIALPAAPEIVKMLVATAFAFAGTMLFILVLRRVRVTADSVVVPLVGIMLGAVVSAATTFLANDSGLLQTMASWRSGGFSSIVRGFYEPLWIVVGIAIAAWILADRFTVAGLGRDLATNAGVSYERIVLLGVTMVALSAGVTAVVVGFIPFLGLVVPNIVSMLLGDDLRRNLPWVAALGAGLLLACDLIGRTIVAPMEIPVSVILGVVGSVVFVLFVLRQRRRARA